MKAILPVVFSLALPLLACPACAETNSPETLKKCADLQVQRDSATKSRNPLFSQIRAQHLEAELKRLRCPAPAPQVSKTSVSSADKKP